MCTRFGRSAAIRSLRSLAAVRAAMGDMTSSATGEEQSPMPIGYRDMAIGLAGRRLRRTTSRFLVGTRAAATSIVTAAVTVMSVAGFAFIRTQEPRITRDTRCSLAADSGGAGQIRVRGQSRHDAAPEHAVMLRDAMRW